MPKPIPSKEVLYKFMACLYDPSRGGGLIPLAQTLYWGRPLHFLERENREKMTQDHYIPDSKGNAIFVPEQPTLRDQFAMHAMNGMVSDPHTREYGQEIAKANGLSGVHEMVATLSYLYADAMIAARGVKS